jgi:catechol 2,3-dioxygenase-like lactoylglutathione lyase family enzyme
MIESISAITLATHNMSRAVRFYRMLGFEIVHGGDDAAFTSFRAGTNYLNLTAQPAERNCLGGDVLSSTIPTLTPSMRAWSRPATVQTRHRAMPNGASGSST